MLKREGGITCKVKRVVVDGKSDSINRGLVNKNFMSLTSSTVNPI